MGAAGRGAAPEALIEDAPSLHQSITCGTLLTLLAGAAASCCGLVDYQVRVEQQQNVLNGIEAAGQSVRQEAQKEIGSERGKGEEKERKRRVKRERSRVLHVEDRGPSLQLPTLVDFLHLEDVSLGHR